MSYKNDTCQTLSTTEHRISNDETTTMDPNSNATTANNNTTKSSIDPTLLNLVNDFFNAQFELKKMQCPLSVHNNLNSTSSTSTLSANNYSRVRLAFRALGKAFLANFEQRLFDMIKQLDLQPQNSCATFYCLSNEMFANGIQWNHIVTYFVFSAEYAFYASQQSAASVHDVAEWLARYTTKHLLPWIDKNGGWDGIVKFAKDTVGNVPNNEQINPLFNLDFKNILCGAAGALGALSLGLFLSSK